MEDGEAIESRLISRQIESAQKRVEARNFDIRKNLLDYDKVMNKQRTAIYSLRNAILDGENVSDRVQQMIEEVVEESFEHWTPENGSSENWDVDSLKAFFSRTFLIDFGYTRDELLKVNREELQKELLAQIRHIYDDRVAYFAQQLVDFKEIERMLMLQLIDQMWKTHLYELDHLQKSVGLRAYGQKDPLIEYQKESFSMKMLKAKLYEVEMDKKRSELEKHYGEKGDIAWGHQIRSYVFMAASLELRVPFLYPEVTEFAFTLPSEYKIRNFKSKWLLRKLAMKYLPEDIVMFFVLAFIMNTVRDQLHPIAVTIPDDAQAQQTSTTTATQQQVSQQASQTFILRVVGGKDLERRLWKALELIWAADRPLFNEFKQFIFVVRLGDRTAFQMENGIPTISVTRAAASRSATWCSGEIIHQYFHARQYYLAQKSTAQELSALGQPQQLRMNADGRKIYQLAPFGLYDNAAAINRVSAVFGNAAKGLLYSSSGFLSAYFSSPDNLQSSRGMQFVFVNRRPVFSKIVQQAVMKAYEGYRRPDRHPAYSIFITLPPADFDVNIHPQKREVRFQDDGAIFRAVYKAVGEGLLGAKTIPASSALREDAFADFAKAVRPEASKPDTIQTTAMKFMPRL